MLKNWVAWLPGYAYLSQGLDSEQKAKVGQKKTKQNYQISFMSQHFCSSGGVTILTAYFSRITNVLYLSL